METLRRRARLFSDIRRYFAASDVLEVDAQSLNVTAGTDPAIEPLTTTLHWPGDAAPRRFYLHTSPEFAMKRLLAAGSGAIYQLGKVFRADEIGRRHAPEFTLLEWYRPGYDAHQLMDDVNALLVAVAGTPPATRIRYGEACLSHAGFDPYTITTPALVALASRHFPEVVTALGHDRGALLDLLFSHLVSPHLGHEAPTFVHDYPVEQAALARIVPGPPPVASRFELFINGMELANGYHELTDATEQRQRFVADNARRRAAGQAEMPLDEALLGALAAGMPECAGVALGVDRLLMVMLQLDDIGAAQTCGLGQAL